MLEPVSPLELAIATEQIRVDNPKAYQQTIRQGQSKQKQLQEYVVEHCTIAHSYLLHQRTTHLFISQGKCVVVLSTAIYWQLVDENEQGQRFIHSGYNMVNTPWTSDKPGCILFKKGNERGIVAPLSEALVYGKDRVATSLTVLCSRCKQTVPFEASVVCCDCLGTCYCSDDCERLDAPTHSNPCSMEKLCATTLVGRIRHSEHFPFVVGLLKDKIVAVPVKHAIDVTIPTMILERCSVEIGYVLIRNNGLVRQVFHDYADQAVQAEAIASQLLEEEENVKLVRKKGSRSRKTGRKIESQMGEVVKCEDAAEVVDAALFTREQRTPSVIPPELVCPITMELYRDPVVSACGHSFERHAIEKWFKRSCTNPMTGAQITHTFLVPNINLRILCQAYRDNGLRQDTPRLMELD